MNTVKRYTLVDLKFNRKYKHLTRIDINQSVGRKINVSKYAKTGNVLDWRYKIIDENPSDGAERQPSNGIYPFNEKLYREWIETCNMVRKNMNGRSITLVNKGGNKTW